MTGTCCNTKPDQVAIDTAIFEGYWQASAATGLDLDATVSVTAHDFLKFAYDATMAGVPNASRLNAGRPFRALSLILIIFADEAVDYETSMTTFINMYKAFIDQVLCRCDSIDSISEIYSGQLERYVVDTNGSPTLAGITERFLLLYPFILRISGNPSSIKINLESLGVYDECNEFSPCPTGCQ